MLLLKTTATSSMKVCCGKETKQILQSALHSLRNTRSSSRFDLASLLQQITNLSSRKLSKKFRNLIGTEKYWGLRNLAGSRCRNSKVNWTYEDTAPQVHRLCWTDGKKQDQEDDFPPRLLWQSWGDQVLQVWALWVASECFLPIPGRSLISDCKQDLVGLFGGIVGLCMGFSLLSGAELIYFFTIRSTLYRVIFFTGTPLKS